MSLVTIDDFDLEPYNIPNLDQVENTFPLFIAQEEDIVLNKILGRLLATKFVAGIIPDEPEERWKNLRDGVLYSYQDKKYYFDGLKKAMVPYIFFKWMEILVESKTGIGVVSSSSENATTVSPEFVLSRSFNDYVCKVGSWKKQKDSLFGYLYNSESIYIDDVSEYGYSSIKTYMDDYFQTSRSRNSFGL